MGRSKPTLTERYERIETKLSEKPSDSISPTDDSLLSDLNPMMYASDLVYVFAILRNKVLRKKTGDKDLNREDLILAKGTKRFNKDNIVDLSLLTDAHITSKNVVDFIMANLEELENQINNDLVIYALIAFSKLGEKAYIVRFDGDLAGETFVYGILINHEDKRITVVFRGSQNVGDWRANLKTRKGNLLTPPILTELGFRKDNISVHRGFKDYLFSKAGPCKVQKYSQIKDRILKLYDNEEYKDYELYITGHSLGGALSTLMSLQLAASRKFAAILGDTPIVNITFASPYVGGKGWKQAFQTLEKAGKIQHIRVSNKDDVVPSVIATSNYTHVGVNLFLNPKAKNGNGYDISYIGNRSLFWQWSLSPMKHHTMDEYFERKNKIKDNLRDLTISSLYADTSLTKDFTA